MTTNQKLFARRKQKTKKQKSKGVNVEGCFGIFSVVDYVTLPEESLDFVKLCYNPIRTLAFANYDSFRFMKAIRAFYF